MFQENQKQCFVVNYNIDKVYDAILNGAKTISGFKIKNENKVIHSISISVGVSLLSWGELVNVSLNDISENKTEININSCSKLGTELGANSKNRKNIDQLLNSMTLFLKK